MKKGDAVQTDYEERGKTAAVEGTVVHREGQQAIVKVDKTSDEAVVKQGQTIVVKATP